MGPRHLARHDHRWRRYALRSVRPSPARAQPADADAWLPLPDVDELPSLPEQRDPARLARTRPHARPGPDVRPLSRRSAVRPSPARAHPHDPEAWFPLRAMEALLQEDRLVDSGPTPTVSPRPATGPSRRQVQDGRRSARALRSRRRRLAGVVVLSVATAMALSRLALAEAGRDDPEVSLTVDGERLTSTTDADTVGELLRDEHVRLRPKDRVVPPASTKIRDGLAVAVHRAFAVNVDLDGKVSVVRTSYTTPRRLMRELGLDPERVAVKLAPDRLGEGASVVLRTRHQVTISVDGQTQSEDSLALDVREFLGENAVVLGPLDTVDPPLETAIADGMVVTVVRVSNDTFQVVEESVQYTVERREDPGLVVGEERVAQEGVPGAQNVTYQITLADGVEVARQAVSRVPTRPAVPKIIVYGTALPNSRSGSASWYASPFGGDSCATKEYVPLGTILRITNEDTGAATTCRVADRVPANRVADLDDDVFRQLAPLGQGVFNAHIEW